MVDRWVAEHPDLRIVKLGPQHHEADRERFGFRHARIKLLDGDGSPNAPERACRRLRSIMEWWFGRHQVDAEDRPGRNNFSPAAVGHFQRSVH
jgi:hypothetical protein